MDQIDVEKMKEKSIADKKRLKKAFQKGEERGMKKGFIKGAFVGFLAAATITAGYSTATETFAKYPTNVGYETAIESYHENSHRCVDVRDYWVDFLEVADDYDPETMDLDSYVYGVYCGLNNVDPNTRLADMNEFMHRLYLENKTEYSSFILYCQSRGLVDLEEGKPVVNEKKYRKAMSEYMKDYKHQMMLEQELQGFREGMNK